MTVRLKTHLIPSAQISLSTLYPLHHQAPEVGCCVVRKVRQFEANKLFPPGIVSGKNVKVEKFKSQYRSVYIHTQATLTFREVLMSATQATAEERAVLCLRSQMFHCHFQ